MSNVSIFNSGCQDLYKRPVIINQCNHTFCRDCIRQSLEFDSQCPLCRKRISIDDFHPNLVVQGLINELLLYCPFKCQQTISYENYESHKLQCNNAPKNCIYKEFGCEFNGSAEELGNHLLNCPYHALRSFIANTNNRIAHLENIIASQQEKLQVLYEHNFDRKMSTDNQGEKAVDKAEPTWPNGSISCKHTISSLRSGISSLAQFGDKLFAGSYDGSIQLIDMNSNEIIDTVNGHRLSVWALAVDFSHLRLYSSGSDQTIKVWSISNMEQPVLSMESNQGKVYSLAVHNQLLFSASSNNTIKIWNLDTFSCVGTLQGHSGGVNSIKPWGNNKLISASNDRSIKIWDIQTMTCDQTIGHHPSEILDISTSSNMLFSSSYDANITAYNLNDFSRAGTLSGHKWEVWKLQNFENFLFSGSHDHTIRRWDIRNLSFSLELCGHNGYIHSLLANDSSLISGCADRTIKIWQ